MFLHSQVHMSEKEHIQQIPGMTRPWSHTCRRNTFLKETSERSRSGKGGRLNLGNERSCKDAPTLAMDVFILAILE